MLAGVTLLGATACLPEAQMPTPPPEAGQGEQPTSVRFIGDSLTFSANGQKLNENLPELLIEQAHQYNLATDVQAMIGAKTEDLVTAVPTLEQTTEKTVIALGTNDRHDGYDRQGNELTPVPTEKAVGNIITYIDSTGSNCYALVGIAETEPWQLNVTGPEYNDRLKNYAEETEGVMYFDWAAEVEANPGNVVPSDGVHFTDDGRGNYRLFLINAALNCTEEYVHLAQPDEPVIAIPEFNS